jgi:Plasmid pRiA4b ORF-3-like protein
MDPSSIPPCVYQFRVVVQGISPLIWRRLLIRSDMALATLHAALQIVFAWSDEHLHCFCIHGKAYGTPRLGGPHIDVDARHMPLAALRLHQGERFSYVYNFIDHWVCDLRLEVIVPLDPRRVYPVCTGVSADRLYRFGQIIVQNSWRGDLPLADMATPDAVGEGTMVDLRGYGNGSHQGNVPGPWSLHQTVSAMP